MSTSGPHSFTSFISTSFSFLLNFSRIHKLFSGTGKKSGVAFFHHAIILALCVSFLFSFSTAQEQQRLVCSSVLPSSSTSVPTSLFTSYLRIDKSKKILMIISAITPNQKVAQLVSYDISKEGVPVPINPGTPSNSKRGPLGVEEISQSSKRVLYTIGTSLFSSYSGEAIFSMVGSEPHQGIFSIQKGGAALTLTYQERGQASRIISSPKSPRPDFIWFSPGPKDLFVTNTEWCYLDSSGVVFQLATRSSGQVAFSPTLQSLLGTVKGALDNLLQSLSSTSQTTMELTHVSSLPVSSNLLSSVRTLYKAPVLNNVLSYLASSNSNTITVSIFVTSDKSNTKLLRIFVLSWGDNGLSQAFYANTSLPSADVLDVTFCQQDSSLCILHATLLSVIPLKDVSLMQSYALPSLFQYSRFIETSLNSYLISNTTIQRFTYPPPSIAGNRLIPTKTLTFADSAAQTQSVSILERDGKEILYYNTLSPAGAVGFCSAEILLQTSPTTSSTPTSAPTLPPTTLAPTRRVNDNDKPTKSPSNDTVPTGRVKTNVNQTFSKVQPERTERPYVPNSVIIIPANENSTAPVPPSLRTSPIASIGLPSEKAQGPRTLKIEGGNAVAVFKSQQVVSTIISISLVDNDTKTLFQPPGPVAICLAVPANYLNNASQAQLVVFNVTSGNWDFVSNVTVRLDPLPPPVPGGGGVARRQKQREISQLSTSTPLPVEGVVYFCGFTTHFSTFSILLSDTAPAGAPGERTEGGVGSNNSGGPPMAIIAGAIAGGILALVLIVAIVGWKSKFYKRVPFLQRNQLYITVDNS